MARITRLLCCCIVLMLGRPLHADGNPMTDSLPRRTGQVTLSGLTAPVTIARDAMSIPVVSGETLRDVIRAQGFLHGQERYVQMDMTRRLAAGELAELAGSMMLESDRRYRRYRFRHVAQQVVALMDDDERALMAAYVEGVNAGLADLGARPPEYQILNAEPAPWTAEDSILVALAMFDMLQDGGRSEPMIDVMMDSLPAELAAFLLPFESRFDVPILPGDAGGGGEAGYRPLPIPGPDVIDLRRRVGRADGAGLEDLASVHVDALDIVIGSNNWAVAGSRSVHGGGIVANDMHLMLTSPGVWYRAQLQWPGRDVGGLTLPGVPGLVTGSSGDVAWGFTNTTGDFQDHIVIEVHPDDPDRYRTPDGWEPFQTITETINVRGRRPVMHDLRATRWGVVTDTDWRGRPLVLKWVALMPEAIDMNLMAMLQIDSVEAGIAQARRIGIPSQNIVMADRDGHVGWIVSGYLPKRIGFSGRRPRSWADGTRRWDGALDESLRPVLADPADGVIYTANNRTVQDERSFLIGHAWASGYRAQRIAELLKTKRTFDERDMLDIQLDTRTVVFDFYRDLVIEATDGDRRPTFREARQIAEQWNGTADSDQPALRLLDALRRTVHAKVFTPLTRACRDADPNYRYRWSFGEETVRRVLEERPAHLLPPRYRDWEDFVESALADTIAELQRRSPDLALAVPWGEVNRAVIGHPLADLAPQLGGALRMPDDPLPGHWSSVRMATPRFGASARMVVSPGREELGIMHMPSGQSGHPMSPHFRDGHAAWVSGRPTPFLPGEPVSRLTLVPEP